MRGLIRYLLRLWPCRREGSECRGGVRGWERGERAVCAPARLMVTTVDRCCAERRHVKGDKRQHCLTDIEKLRFMSYMQAMSCPGLACEAFTLLAILLVSYLAVTYNWSNAAA